MGREVEADARQQLVVGEIAITGEAALFDVVVVDGMDRLNCIYQCVGKLSDRGVIILDDSHFEEYRPAIDWLEAQGFRCLTISGLKPVLKKPHSTSVFYRDGNCFGL